MKRIIGVFSLVALMTACGPKKNELSLEQRIDSFEDSVEQWGGGLGSKEEINGFAARYIQTLVEAYKEKPDGPKAALYLHRTHMWYTTMENHNKALEYGLQVINEFPKYENRLMVLESVASLYDMDIEPRDSVQVRTYYEMALKEFPNMEADKKNGIINRLKYNHLNFMDFVIKQVDLDNDPAMN